MLTLTSVAPNIDAKDAPISQLVRTPFYIRSQGQAVFVCLHSYGERRDSKGCIIICPPVGHEQIHSHRSLRHLADALASAGFEVLRFDYLGTGDSEGIDEQVKQVSAWSANIADLTSWLRQQGCANISLLGLRLGAALAMQVAAEIDVENLILWAPVVKGRQFVRELTAIGMAAEKKPQRLPNAPGDIEVAGFVVTKQTADSIGSIDLLNVRSRCKNVLLMTRDDLPEDQRLLDHLKAQGIDALRQSAPGYADMMAEPHLTKVPTDSISTIVDWLARRAEKQGVLSYTVPVENTKTTWAAISHVSFTAHGFSSEQPIVERVLRLRGTPALVGIISEPQNASHPGRPLIFLTNAGAAHRVGPSRFYVLLARELAAQGFRCLRMDLAGLGDSIARPGERENDPYCETAFRDIEQTLTSLKTQLNIQRVVLMGLCSGAYMAFQSAAQSHNPTLVESVLINPLTYYWREGMSIQLPPDEERQTYHYYMQAALQPRKWLKFLTGGTKIGIVGAMKLWANQLRRPSKAAPIETDHVLEKPGHPLVENVAADLDRISGSGRQLTCFFSRGEPGYKLLLDHAGSKVAELRRAGILKIYFVEKADHTFSERVPRLEALRAICQHLRERY